MQSFLKETITHTGSTVNSDGNLSISAGNDINVSASDISATNDLSLDAGNDITLTSQKNSELYSVTESSESAIKTKQKAYGSFTETNARATFSGANINFNAGGSIDKVGIDLNATDTLKETAVDGISTRALNLKNESWHEEHEGLKGPFKALAKALAFTGGMMGFNFNMDVAKGNSSRTSTTKADGSNINTTDYTAQTDGAWSMEGSDFTATGDASIKADSVLITAAQETSSTEESSYSESVSGEGIKAKKDEVSVGYSEVKQTETTTTDTTSYKASNFNAGNLTIKSKQDTNILGSNVNVDNDADITSTEGNINIAALTGETTTTHEKETITKTVSVGVRNAYLDAAYALLNINNAKKAIKEAENRRDQAKDKIAAGKMDPDDIKYFDDHVTAAKINLVQATLAAAKAGAAAIGNTATAGFTASGNASTTTEKENSTKTDQKTYASSLNIGGNTKLKAQDEINITGSDVTTGGDIGMTADRLNITSNEENNTSSSSSSKDTTSVSASSSGAIPNGGSASHDTTKTESSSQSTNHRNSTINSGGTLTINTNETTIAGANVDADTIDIDTNKLIITSRQNTSSSTSKTESHNASMSVSGGSGESSATPSGLSLGTSNENTNTNRAYTDDQTTLNARNEMSIKAKDTSLTGAVISNTDATGQDQGNLSITTGTLTVTDLEDTDQSKTQGSGVNISGNGDNVDLSRAYASEDKQGITKATIGKGIITFTDKDGNPSKDCSQQDCNQAEQQTYDNNQQQLASLNRDTTNSQETTRDWSTDRIDTTLKIDTRVLTEKGRKGIKKDYLDSKNHAQEVTQAVVDVATTDKNITDLASQVHKYATDRTLLTQKSSEQDTQDKLKGEEGAEGSQEALAQLSDELSNKDGLTEEAEVNLYDGEAIHDDTITTSENDFNKQTAKAGYHENNQDIYINIDQTDMTDSSQTVKSLMHEQERHTQAQQGDTDRLDRQSQTDLAQARAGRAETVWNDYSDLHGINTKSDTNQRDWNTRNRNSNTVTTGTNKIAKVNSKEIKPFLVQSDYQKRTALIQKCISTTGCSDSERKVLMQLNTRDSQLDALLHAELEACSGNRQCEQDAMRKVFGETNSLTNNGEIEGTIEAESNGNFTIINSSIGDDGNYTFPKHDPYGGLSYGIIQLASKSGGMKEFMNALKRKNTPEAIEMYRHLQEAGGLKAAESGNPAFKRTFDMLAQNPQFIQFQLEVGLNGNNATAIKKRLAQFGVDITQAPKDIQEQAMQMIVQQGRGGVEGRTGQEGSFANAVDRTHNQQLAGDPKTYTGAENTMWNLEGEADDAKRALNATIKDKAKAEANRAKAEANVNKLQKQLLNLYKQGRGNDAKAQQTEQQIKQLEKQVQVANQKAQVANQSADRASSTVDEAKKTYQHKKQAVKDYVEKAFNKKEADGSSSLAREIDKQAREGFTPGTKPGVKPIKQKPYASRADAVQRILDEKKSPDDEQRKRIKEEIQKIIQETE